VKRGHRAAKALPRQALVQAMEQIGAPGPPRPAIACFAKDGVPHVAGHRGAQRFEEAVRPIAEQERDIGVSQCQAVEDLPRVDAHTGEVAVQAIGGVQGEFQRLRPYSFSFL